MTKSEFNNLSIGDTIHLGGPLRVIAAYFRARKFRVDLHSTEHGFVMRDVSYERLGI